jgi:hypothetical protein
MTRRKKLVGVDESNGFNAQCKFFKTEFDNIDVVGTYKRLKDIGELPLEDLRDRDKLSMAINRTGRHAFDAGRIYEKTRMERELFRIEKSRKMRELTRLAIARINTWMDATETKRKQVTQKMIEEEIAAGDDTRGSYEALIREEESLKEMRNNLESFKRQWDARLSALQTQAGLLKSRKEMVFGGKKGD